MKELLPKDAISTDSSPLVALDPDQEPDAVQLEALDEEGFDEWLDEIGEPCKVGTLEYSQSRVLKECDPTAYRVCFTDDYQESMRENIEQEVRDELETLLED